MARAWWARGENAGWEPFDCAPFRRQGKQDKPALHSGGRTGFRANHSSIDLIFFPQLEKQH
jgi:hypothetical protein